MLEKPTDPNPLFGGFADTGLPIYPGAMTDYAKFAVSNLVIDVLFPLTIML